MIINILKNVSKKPQPILKDHSEKILDIQYMIAEIKNSKNELVYEVEDIGQKLKQKENDVANRRGKRTSLAVSTSK